MKTLLPLIAVVLLAGLSSAALTNWDVVKLAVQRYKDLDSKPENRGAVIDAVIDGMQKANGREPETEEGRRELIADFLSGKAQGNVQALQNDPDALWDALINYVEKELRERAGSA
ncbi:uncharacterized protein [Branchiostoma lanceolatum]|uniref:uncharacterized protein n=1 Tax=Branchiostoma lanceolatum TaxID=7740 RepID=UPI00345229E1